MRLAWMTDIHLNFTHLETRLPLYEELKKSADAILITGDIGEHNSVAKFLKQIQKHTSLPIYFVLGNHDFYMGSVKKVYRNMRYLTSRHPNIKWLRNEECGVELVDKTILCGVDGWADGRYGDYANSNIRLNDSVYIQELADAFLDGMLLQQMQQLADTDARILLQQLLHAVQQQPERIIIASHVPPFDFMSTYRGQLSDPHFMPFYSTKALGDVIRYFVDNYPEIQFKVLAGHTHGELDLQVSNNMHCLVGGAEYYRPTIAKVFFL